MSLADPAMRLLGEFAFGYLAVCAVPGPNMLAIGAQAALRGMRGVLPVCLGVALGAGALAAALQHTFGALTEVPELQLACRVVGAALLIGAALRAALAPRPEMVAGCVKDAALSLRVALLTFAAGFATAVSNPVTAAFFLSQFLGPLADAEAHMFAVPVVVLQALAWSALVAAVFARPSVRRLAANHHRAVCLVSGAALAVLGVAMLAPVLA